MFPNVEQYQAALQQNLAQIIVDKSYHSASIEAKRCTREYQELDRVTLH